MCSKLNVDIIIDTILWWHCDTMFGSMIVSTFHFEYIVKVLEKHKYMEGESLIPYICTLWPNNVIIKHVISTYLLKAHQLFMYICVHLYIHKYVCNQIHTT
jgi:hypothetical protein